MPLDQNGNQNQSGGQGNGGSAMDGGVSMHPDHIKAIVNEHVTPALGVIGAQFHHHDARIGDLEKHLHGFIKMFHDYGRGKMRESYHKALHNGPHGEALKELDHHHSKLYGKPLSEGILESAERDGIPEEGLHEYAGHFVEGEKKRLGPYISSYKEPGEDSPVKDDMTGKDEKANAGASGEMDQSAEEGALKTPKGESEKKVEKGEKPREYKEEKKKDSNDMKEEEETDDPVMRMHKHLKEQVAGRRIRGLNS